jgi:hypothetical protein
MKRLYSLAIMLMVIVGVMGVPVMAQEDVEETGVLIITVDDGSSLAYADDGETLLLNIVSSVGFAPGYVLNQNGFITTNYGLLDLQNDWSFAGELSASAVLEFGESRLNVVVGEPTYDVATDILTYVVFEIEGVELDKDSLAILPDVTNGSLFIELNTTFLDTLLAGRDERLSATRVRT